MLSRSNCCLSFNNSLLNCDYIVYFLYSLDQYTQEQKKELIEVCPSKVFEFGSYHTLKDHPNPTSAVVVARPSDCIFCKECIFLSEEFRSSPEDPLGVSVQHSNSKFTFTVESTGALLAREIVRDALSALAEKIKYVKEETDKIKANMN